MISEADKNGKAKQILMESFDRRSVKRSNTQKLMDNMLRYKQQAVRKSREEEYEKKMDEWKSEGSFDLNTLGVEQKKPKRIIKRTRKVKPLTEQQRWSKELDEILEELERGE